MYLFIYLFIYYLLFIIYLFFILFIYIFCISNYVCWSLEHCGVSVCALDSKIEGHLFEPHSVGIMPLDKALVHNYLSQPRCSKWVPGRNWIYSL